MHVEALKSWTEPTLPINYLCLETESQHDLPGYKPSLEFEIEAVKHNLNYNQLVTLKDLLLSFAAVTDPKLNRIHLISHKIT